MCLLPDLEELKPITDKNNTFYECGFNKNFDNLSFEKKLKVLCDIVRQSIYPNGHPNPDTEILEMNGNCYTASHVFLNYIKKLNIGINGRVALARKRSFDLDDVTSIHITVLIDSIDGHTYQVEPLPFAGYKFGSVEDITHKKTYNEYVVIDNRIDRYLYQLRKVIYENHIDKFDKIKLKEYIELCDIVSEYPILSGYVVRVLKIISNYLDNKYEQDKTQKKINIIKPYNKNNISKLVELQTRLEKEINIWIEELRDLQQSNKDYERQLELALSIVQEKKWLDDSYERYTFIDGGKISLSSINPRLLYEKEYNAIIMNTSLLDKIETQNLKVIDLLKPTEQLGLNPILFFHPGGEEYVRTMYGDTKLILFMGKNKEIELLKSKISKYGNLFYESNSYSDSALKYLSLHLEHQTMTRFMYPNPKLKKTF